MIKSTIQRKLALITLMGFLWASVINTMPVSAADDCTIPDKNDPKICLDEYFGSNDILFYDPNAEECTLVSGGANTTTLIGNDNTEKVFLYFTGKGLSAEQAAGIIANFKKEAYDRIDPGAIQNGAIADANYVPVHGTGFGIAQWTWSDRQLPLVELSKSSNRTIIDLSLQLDYVWDELTNRFPHAMASLKAATTPEQAAYVFHRDYEASNDTEAAILATRAEPARTVYEQLKDLAPSNVNTTDSVDCNQKTGSGLTEFMGDDFVIYNQCQYPPYGGTWGTRQTPYGQTMCSAACGPTALAMLARNMTGSAVTPNETIDYYTTNNHWHPAGGSWIRALAASADFFGLRAEPVANKSDVNAYKEVFDKGGLISVSAIGTSPFLPQGHTILLRGITAENKFMIADPGYKETNISPANEFDVEKILTDVRGDGGSVVNAYYKK